MTNYNERLDKIVNNLSGRYSGSIAIAMLAGGHPEETIFMMNKYSEEAKQALTSLIKELVAVAKPPVIDTPSRIKLYADNEGQMWYDRGQNDAIVRFEQNL